MPLRPKTWPKESEQSMIAICLVIVDTLHHEDIWRAWCEKGSEGKHYQARLFIHAKYPEKIKSAWVKSNLIDVTFRPEWNSVEVVQALLSTLDTALQYIDNNSRKDGATDATKEVTGVPKCGRFLFGTETCLPLYDLQYIGETLFAENCSWLNAYHTPVGTWEAGACFRAVDAEVVPPQVYMIRHTCNVLYLRVFLRRFWNLLVKYSILLFQNKHFYFAGIFDVGYI